jgi:Retroviral aspartyl protease
MPNPLVVPYSELGFGGARPYLFLQITGLDGRSRTVPGLIDSGADNSVLPAGYAPIMGYSGADLALVQGSQVSGSVTLRRATKPAAAYVPEFPDLVFDMWPFFVDGCQHALWGRADLMRHFDVTIVERLQQFSLIPATESA